MKKVLAIVLAVVMVASFAACGKSASEGPKVDAMTYAEYSAAAIDSEVTVACYVQAKQGWWEKEGVGVITVYAQDKDGAYFLYEMPCSKEDSEKLVPGTRLLVKGTKAEWQGQIEIIDSTFEIIEGTYVAEAKDVTSSLTANSDDIAPYMNQFVAFKGLKVVADQDGNAWKYKWNNSGSEGDDLYFDVEANGVTFTFTVESYLCGPDTDVYKTVKSFKDGDIVDLEGFAYWYNGLNPHITNAVVK